MTPTAVRMFELVLDQYRAIDALGPERPDGADPEGRAS